MQFEVGVETKVYPSLLIRVCSELRIIRIFVKRGGDNVCHFKEPVLNLAGGWKIQWCHLRRAWNWCPISRIKRECLYKVDMAKN